MARRYAEVLVSLRWWVIGFWLLSTAASVFLLPTLSSGSSADTLRGLLPDDTPAIRNEVRSAELFGFPLLGRTAVVQRDPGGLSVATQGRTLRNAAALNQGSLALPPLRGAVPIANTLGIFPSSSELGTTAVTYFLVNPGATFSAQTRAADRYAERLFEPDDSVVGVTGSVPARAQQGRIIRDHLHEVEIATLTAIVLIVGLYFRSLVAPVVTLATTGVAYLLTLRLSGYVAALLGVASPSELEPVVVALLLGVVTDYVVFFCSALRPRLVEGMDRHAAARAATAQFGPIIGVAGLAVAAGTAALLVAESTFFRALGPALVFTVLTALAVALTLVPALMAVLGKVIFWPSQLKPARADLPLDETAETPALTPRSIVGRLVATRVSAALTLTACVAVLALAAWPLVGLQLGVSFVGALPSDSDVSRAADAAEDGFAAGILSPTVVLVEGERLDQPQAKLARFANALEQVDGVAGVLGPSDLNTRVELGVLLKGDGSAARYLVVLDEPPLGAAAIDTLERLQRQLSALLAASGLRELHPGPTTTTAGLIGDTATAAFIVDQTRGDLLRIAVAALLANLVMLVIFLRALVAPLMLLAASVLSLLASLGVTTWVFDITDPGAGLVFYVPFAAAVLLLAFGSDYNIFGVGHIWELAGRRPLREAIAVAIPQTSRPIAAAGLALAASFGMLALVPLESFRQLAFAMAVGITLDVLVVRSLLMPALLSTVGSASACPSRRLRHQLQGREREHSSAPAPATGT